MSGFEYILYREILALNIFFINYFMNMNETLNKVVTFIIPIFFFILINFDLFGRNLEATRKIKEPRAFFEREPEKPSITFYISRDQHNRMNCSKKYEKKNFVVIHHPTYNVLIIMFILFINNIFHFCIFILLSATSTLSGLLSMSTCIAAQKTQPLLRATFFIRHCFMCFIVCPNVYGLETFIFPCYVELCCFKSKTLRKFINMFLFL